MERNAGKGIALDPAGGQVDDTGELASATDQSAELAPLYERVGEVLKKDRLDEALADKDRPVAALLADLSPGTADALLRQARSANASRLIGAGSDISLAIQNAPKAFAETGKYPGVMRGPEDFATVFGAEEGGRQFANLDRQVKTGQQVFDMHAMPDRQIQARLRAAAAGAGQSPEDQLKYETTAAAAQQIWEARWKDPAGQAGKALPQVDAAWRAAAEQGWRDPAAVQNALALSIAAQHYLGVGNARPVPQSVLKDLGGLPPQDMWAGMNGLLAGTTDPVVKAAVKQQFAEAGLLGGPSQAPKAAPLDHADFDRRLGPPSSAPLKAENGSPLTQAPAQSAETLGAGNAPVAAGNGSQVSTSELANDNSGPSAELTQALPEQMDPPPGRPEVPPVTSDPTAQPVGDNSDSPVDPKEASSEQLEPPPGSAEAPSIDFSKGPPKPQSKSLSKGWSGHSTVNISVLPKDVQESAKPYTEMLGKNFGDGQCVALTKEVGGMSKTTTTSWKKGEKVQANNKILPGTPIATFNGDWDDGQGRVHYGPKTSPHGKGGFSHTGIYLGQNESGIFILDQWAKDGHPQKARITFRPWHSAAQGLESGAYYYIIEK